LLTKLSGLQIDGNLLIGTIPTELGNLIDLMELDLDKNELFGSIPTEIGRMVNLIELDLSKSKSSNTGRILPTIKT
jgi:Leucine-rich repeat (LRR) protein